MPIIEKNARLYEKAPLDIINESKNIIIALFSTQDTNSMNSTSTIAMRVNSEDFISMINLAKDYNFLKCNGEIINVNDIIYHDPTNNVSVYFVDP
ncbi:MAG: hypothetical protein EP298_01730 [Gammaproteobacteria bacterium]|nr:MAG: hypothetical protein EP298_01730 [Gammaproteobacteria bacterium]UTW43925.1 hypothetical protein KFE69_07500 [bacterium SCSIO 12844]